MDGNLWKIQCKREKQLGPTKVKAIVDEGVEKIDPPYGYILVAPANFSKQSYDAFRTALRAKGVMEFHLWGKPELEDMLFLPKNDNILFAFFGFSLITRKRSRASEIKFSIINKNKLVRALGDGDQRRKLHKSILVRDFKDTHYPYEGEYGNFAQLPRWKEYTAVEFHPLGLIVDIGRYYACCNDKTKEWDFVATANLLDTSEDHDDRKAKFELREKPRNFWRYLPRANQFEFLRRSIIFFEDMFVIDEKGDVRYPFPHIFVDFKAQSGPFRGSFYSLQKDGQEISLTDEYKKISFFPDNFPTPPKRKVYRDRVVQLDEEALRHFGEAHFLKNLFDVDGKYKFLRQGDIIRVAGGKPPVNEEETFIEITHKYKQGAKDYINERQWHRTQIEKQIGRKLDDTDVLTVLEFDRVYSWQINGE